MSQVVITQRIEWDMGHRLGDGYASKCRHLHGHRYAAEITLAAPSLDRYGMVIDFGDVKRLCKGWIDDRIDHAVLVHDADASLLEFLRSEGDRHHVVDFNTTVENIAPWLAAALQAVLDDEQQLRGRGLEIVRLKLFETPNSSAEWQR